MCASLGEALTGEVQGQVMLETLERQGLFLSPLDDRREWYRYHPIFAGFLRDALNRRHPGEVAGLHRRAARWYWAHDLPRPAFAHTLAGEDGEFVDEIIGHAFSLKLHSGEIAELKRWLDSMPAEWRRSYPGIALAQAGLYLYEGRPAEASQWLDAVERSLTDEQAIDLRQTGLAAMRCFVACFQNDVAQAEVYAGRALQEVSDAYLDMRAGVFGALGDTYRRNGQWQKAQQSYLSLLDYAAAPSFRVEAVHVFGALADLALRQGQLRTAGGYWRRALDAIQEEDKWGKFPLPLTGWVYIRMGELLVEWNDLDAARDHLTEGLARAEMGGDPRTLISGYLALCHLELSNGDAAKAENFLDRAHHLLRDTQFSEWRSRYERLQLQTWLNADKLQTAVEWTNEMLERGEAEARPEGEPVMPAMARVLVAAGDAASLDRALALLDSLLQQARQEGRGGILVEGLALQALARDTRGETAEALVALEAALRLAEPEGYVRTFVDLGLPFARLLQDAVRRDIAPDYAAALLDAFGTRDPLYRQARTIRCRSP